MKAIFIVTGLPNSGRNTFINEVRDTLVRSSTLSFHHILDNKMKLITPKNPTKKQLEFLNKIRELLIYSSLIATEIINIIKSRDGDKTIFFIKTNNPEDIIMIRRAFPKKVKVIYIDRGLKWSYVNYLPEDFKYNYKIDNKGTLNDFKKAIHSFINLKVPSKLFYDGQTFNMKADEQ